MKHLPIGNGKILWVLDQLQRPRHVIDLTGRWEPLAGDESCRIGILTDGRAQWIDREGEVETEYEDNSQSVRSVVRFAQSGTELAITSTALHDLPVLLRKIEIVPESDQETACRLVISDGLRDAGGTLGGGSHHDAQIGGIVQHRGHRFLASVLRTAEGEGPVSSSVWPLGETRRKGPRLTGRDLDGITVAQGPAGMALLGDVLIPPGDSRTIYHWLILGGSYRELLRVHEQILKDGCERAAADAARHSRLWLQGLSNDWDIPTEVLRLYRRSLLLLACHTSPEGAVVEGVPAEGASEVGVVWPARAALAAAVLAEAGELQLPARIVRWLARTVEPEGYFLPSYLADGSWAASPVSWTDGSRYRPPISGDAAAATLWAAQRVVRLQRNLELATELARTAVRSILNQLLTHRLGDTGLPAPAVDPWGREHGIWTYACAATYAGFQAGVELLRSVGDETLADASARAAVSLREGLVEHFYNPSLGRFSGGATSQNGQLTADPRVDVSAASLVLFDVLAANNPIVESTMRAVRDRLWAQGSVGGLALRDGAAGDGGGRLEPSPLCTLWLARWSASRAKTQKQLGSSLDLLRWAALVAGTGGALPEALDPATGAHRGATPSIWAHAEFVAAVLEVARRSERR